jgi:hypothetical protein
MMALVFSAAMVFPEERALNNQLCKEFYIDATKTYLMNVEIAASACQLAAKETYYCLNGTTTTTVSTLSKVALGAF